MNPWDTTLEELVDNLLKAHHKAVIVDGALVDLPRKSHSKIMPLVEAIDDLQTFVLWVEEVEQWTE